jgi:hypothetical protein
MAKKGQNNKEQPTTHYAEDQRLCNTNPTKNRGRTRVHQRVKQFLLYMLPPSWSILTQAHPYQLFGFVVFFLAIRHGINDFLSYFLPIAVVS